MIAPLCIIQCRFGSTRLPGKMMERIGRTTLIQRAWETACEAFGREDSVIAIPHGQPVEFRNHLDDIGANVRVSPAPEDDVLLRFFHVAHWMRWHPNSVIVRYTPDDWRKSVDGLRRVAAGERLPVEIGGEAFTLAQLRDAATRHAGNAHLSEHITYALFPVHPEKPPDDGLPWSIDTYEDLAAARAKLAEMEA